MTGVPSADAPRPGEIGYYAPTQSLVLFYASPGRWPGLVRAGRFDHPVDQLRALPDGTRIAITAAQQTASSGRPGTLEQEGQSRDHGSGDDGAVARS